MMRKTQARALGAVAVVTAMLLGIASAAEASALPAPPRPVVAADGGASRYAAAGSYCWSNGRRGVCADTIDPMEHAPKLHVQAGTEPTIRMGYPVQRLVAYTRGGEKLELNALDESRRKYELVLPTIGAGELLGVYLQADYDRGDALFAVRLKSRFR